MSNDDLSAIMDMVQSLGQWAVFLWLYLRERSAHQVTIEQCRADRMELSRIAVEAAKHPRLE